MLEILHEKFAIKVSLILFASIGIYHLGFSQIINEKNEIKSDSVIIFFDTQKKGTEIKDNYDFFKKNINEEFRIIRGNYQESDYYLYLSHIPLKNQSVLSLTLMDLNKFRILWDKDLDYKDWASLWTNSKANKTVFFIIFQNEFFNKNRFALSYKLKAYEVMIRTGAIE